MSDSNPLQTQIAGDHYKTKAIQPIEFSMANKLDGCAHSIVKYVSRHPEKGGKADLEKAFHFVQLRETLATEKHMVHDWVVGMDEYCHVNQMGDLESSILRRLALWLESNSPLYPHLIKTDIRLLMLSCYPTEF
jgi:hypothetical protein